MPVIPIIQKTKTPSFPQFVFEWHENTQKVYVIELPGKFEDSVFVPDTTIGSVSAVAIAEHCEHHARFLGFVQTWLRGYRKGKLNEDIGTR